MNAQAGPTSDEYGQTPASEAEAAEVAAELSAQAARIGELEAEVAKFKDQWIRAVAEADNIRKRSAKEIEDAGKYAATSFARDMVGVLENLQRAVAAATPEARAASEALRTLAEGVELTAKELLSVFEKQGIRRIDPAGQKFDHNLHQAVAQVESEQPAGNVAQVLQAGYTIHERLLRPAMVSVSKGMPEPPAHTSVDTIA